MAEKIPYTKQPGKLFLARLLELYENSPEYVCCCFLDRMGEIEQRITIGDWMEGAGKLAAVFKAKGVQPGDRIILALPTSREFLEVFLASWWTGVIPVPLINPMAGLRKEAFRDRLVHMIADCHPKAAIFMGDRKNLVLDVRDEKPSSSLPDIEVWNWEELSSQVGKAGADKDLEPYVQAKETIAFLQYTSGSTGNPKGVTVTQGSLCANIRAIAEASGLATISEESKESDSCLSWMPFYHDMGLIGGLLFNTYFQIPLYLLSPVSFLTRPSVWIESINRYRITLSTGNNFAYHLCARRIHPDRIPGLDLSCWRLAYNGSEPVNAKTLESFAAKFSPYGFSENAFYPVYGMAEATLAITLPRPGTPPRIDRVKRKELTENGTALPTDDGGTDSVVFVSNGPCVPGHSLRIKEPGGEKVLGEREIGEICFSGPSVTPGYFTRDRSYSAQGDELRTGDLGYLADGNLYAVDRLKDVVQIAGNTYFPSDIEREVERVSGTRPGRTVSFDVPNSESGTNELVVVAAIAAGSDPSDLKKEIRNQVYKAYGLAPQDIVLTDKKNIPITSSGKIRRQRCRELFLRGELTPAAGKAG
ncbi:MAG: fatty acyl-AMP ligase [Proteobacteria bacterium]|nr:fatty acyl-AMP ligase [Pseudomonadota bacterium]